MTGTGGRPRRRLALGAVAVLVVLAAALVAGPPAPGGDLDPRATGPSGLRGLVDLAEALDGHVDIATDLPDDTSTRVLLARDDLASEQRDALTAWVEDGGTAVVADPASPVHGLVGTGAPLADRVGARSRAPGCDLPALAGVERVTHAGWTGLAPPDGSGDPTAGPVPTDAGAGEVEARCFAGDGDAWLVALGRGDGRVVALGSPAPLVNALLDRDDNAVLAAGLLFPAPGDRLTVLEGAAPTTGPDLAELVPPRIRYALALALLAALVAVAAVARRLGRPVEERLPPTVPSAELTRSVGDLLQRARRPDAAAERLRAVARAEVGRRLGPDLPAEALAERAVARLGIDPTTAATALLDRPVEDDDGLVAVAAAVVRMRERLRAPS